MFDKIIKNVCVVIKDKDIQTLAKSGSVNLFSLFVERDITSLPASVADMKNLVLSIPNIIFADKMYRFLTKSFSDFDMQIKFAARFENDSEKYYETVKKQLQLLDKMEFDEKVNWFANLTRAVSLECIDIDTYLKLSTAVCMLLVDDLKALKFYFGKKDEPENSTLSNYFAYGLTTKITPTTYGTLVAKHTLSTKGVELLKYGIDFENCEKYKVPEKKQDGENK